MMSVFVAICTAGCVNGNCTEPNNCTCENGWKGVDCNKGNNIYFQYKVKVFVDYCTYMGSIQNGI